MACLGGCGDPCGNTVIKRSVSPDGQHSAVLFERNCGATTGFSTQISVLIPNEAPTDGGNAFVAGADDDTADTGYWGGPSAEMEWLAPGHLLVRFASGSNIFVREENVDGVKITFKAAS